MKKTIPTDKHVFVCGRTGTGKSYLAERYLAGYEYVVKLDTKDETSERHRAGLSPWVGLKEDKDFVVCRHFEDLDDIETKKIIYVPDYDDQTEENFNKFFRWLFERENTIGWIDELMSVGTSRRCPRELGRIYQQGRSKNVGIWACSQRPSDVPLNATANSSYFFVFDLNLPQDRDRLAKATGMMEMYESPHGHNFWYYEMGTDKCIKGVLTN